MRSRTLREGSTGLLILLGLGVLGGLILWIRGFNPTRRSYHFTIDFSYISGMEVGAPVRYRGVTVGKTRSIQPGANAVEVEVEIQSANLLIPQDVMIQVIQSGLVGETYIDIIPNTDVPAQLAVANPLSSRCDSTVIVCNGDHLIGESGISFSQLIGSITRFTDLFSNPEIVGEIRTLTRNSANAASGVAELTQEVSNLSRLVRQELGQLSGAATATVTSVGRAADSIALTSVQVEELIDINRSSLIGTLDNINRATDQLQLLVGGLAPVLSEEGVLIQNLETLSVNAAQASANLRDLTDTVGNSENLLLLQQTLDSARATFQNAQKITADLDELTGDPAFRENLRNLINGLSNLVSVTEDLQDQAELAHLLTETETALNAADRQDSESVTRESVTRESAAEEAPDDAPAAIDRPEAEPPEVDSPDPPEDAPSAEEPVSVDPLSTLQSPRIATDRPLPSSERID